MDWKQYVEESAPFAIYPKDDPDYVFFGFLSEAGEIADKIKKHKRDGVPLDLDALQKELGDCYWYLARDYPEGMDDVYIKGIGMPGNPVRPSLSAAVESYLRREYNYCRAYLGYTTGIFGSSQSEILEMNLAKLRDRAERNALHGNGDNR